MVINWSEFRRLSALQWFSLFGTGAIPRREPPSLPPPPIPSRVTSRGERQTSPKSAPTHHRTVQHSAPLRRKYDVHNTPGMGNRVHLSTRLPLLFLFYKAFKWVCFFVFHFFFFFFFSNLIYIFYIFKTWMGDVRYVMGRKVISNWKKWELWWWE